MSVSYNPFSGFLQLNPTSTGSSIGGPITGSTNYSVLSVDGSGNLSSVGPLTSGQLIIGRTGNSAVGAFLTGTSNQVIVTNGSGSITLSLPQNINTTSSPTFANLTVSTINGGTSSGNNNGDVTLGASNGLSLVGQILSLGVSSSSTTGALTSTDWFTFNNKLNLSGGTMSGNIAMGGNKITGLSSGTISGDALQYGQIGSPNGIAPLDASSKIPSAYLPSTVLQYQGLWTPSTNTPTLQDSTGTDGFVYQISGGTLPFAGPISGLTDPTMVNFQLGNLVIYSGSIGKWEQTTPAAGVQSVNSAQGNVTVNAINQLTGDVTTTSTSGSQSKSATVVAINGTNLAGLSTGILKNTTGTGIPSIAIAGDFPILNQNTTGTADKATNVATTTKSDAVTYHPVFVLSNATSLSQPLDVGALAYQASLNKLSATTFSASQTLSTGTALSVDGILSISNATTNQSISVKSNAPASSYNFILPDTVGSSGQFLTSAAGSGPMTWSFPSISNLATPATAIPFGNSGGTGLTTDVSAINWDDTAKVLHVFNVNLGLSPGSNGTIAMGNTVISTPGGSGFPFQIYNASNNGLGNIIIGNFGTNTISLQNTVTSSSGLTEYINFSGGPNALNGKMIIGSTANNLYGRLDIIGQTTYNAVSILAPSPSAPYNFNLPTTAGTSGQVLTSQGGGSTAMTWTNNNTTSNDISETTFTDTTDIRTNQNVTGFLFNNANVRSFSAIVSVNITGSNLFADFTLKGIQRSSDWVLTSDRGGDDTGVTFNITTSGQIQFSKTTTSGFTSSKFVFRALTTKVF